jgi:hypothetical protein
MIIENFENLLDLNAAGQRTAIAAAASQAKTHSHGFWSKHTVQINEWSKPLRDDELS